jgi:phage antirepressor YoqD-like protein
LDVPKVEFANAVHDTIDLIQVGDFCKILNNKGVKIGRNRLKCYVYMPGHEAIGSYNLIDSALSRIMI